MRLVLIMTITALMVIGVCSADNQNAVLPIATVQHDDFNLDAISDKDLEDYNEKHPIVYHEPTWTELKFQEFASWLIVTFPGILTVAGAAIDYKDAFDAWWEAHHAPLRTAYCAEYPVACATREPNTCELHQYALIQWLREKFAGNTIKR